MLQNTHRKKKSLTEAFQTSQSDNSTDDFKKSISAFEQNYIIYPTYPMDNKNGFPEKIIKTETKKFNHFEANSGEIKTKLENIENYNLNSIFTKNDKLFLSDYNNIKFKLNYLEPRIDHFFELGDFYKIPDFENHLYNVNNYCKLNEDNFLIYPLISILFIRKKNMLNNSNNIYSNRKKFIDKKSKSYKYYLSKYKSKTKRSFINNPNFKLVNYEIDELFIKFIIPENFLINFNIKEIIIKDIEINTNKEKKPFSVNLKEIEIFLNNLCKNVIINKEGEYNSYFNGEYVEYKSFAVKKGEIFLIEKIQKNALELEKYKPINNNLIDYRRSRSKRNNNLLKNKNNKSNKKKNEKIKNNIKLNKQKNGEKKIGYLNQFQINKINLKNFPFFPSANIEKFIKVKEILKSIIEDNIIGFKQKTKIINDERNVKYIINKRFEIIYQNKEKNAQYILCLNEFHILYLIFYYYYQIKEGLLSINQKYIDHKSKNEIVRAMNYTGMLINKCNIIVSKISK